MRKALSILTDLGSVLLAIGVLVFFLYFPNYKPPGENGVLIGIVIALVIVVIYLVLEGSMTMGDKTPTPLYFAFETEVSHFPGYALLWVVAAWYYNATVLSGFQWTVFVIIAAAVAADLFGVVTVVARQLLLTDEMKHVR